MTVYEHAEILTEFAGHVGQWFSVGAEPETESGESGRQRRARVPVLALGHPVHPHAAGHRERVRLPATTASQRYSHQVSRIQQPIILIIHI